MLFNNKYPYTDFHELNLSWVICKLKEMSDTITNWINYSTIKFADPIEWDKSSHYEANTIVIDTVGNSYLSKKEVPAGISISNEEYWFKIGNYNAQLQKVEEEIPQHVNKVLTVYCNVQAGDDDNVGSEDKPFKTLGRAMRLFNEGCNNLGVVFQSSGTYYIETRCLTAANLHLSTANNADVVVKSSDDNKFIVYTGHLNFMGTPGHLLKIDIPTFRLDCAQLWCTYCDFEYQFSGNATGSRFDNCTWQRTLYLSQGNAFIISPTVLNKENNEYAIHFSAACVFITGTFTIGSPTADLGSNSKVFLLQGSFCGMQNITVPTFTTEYKYNWVVRTYAGLFDTTNAERNKLIPLANTTILNSGEIWQNP